MLYEVITVDRTCGADGCGGTCGACQEGQICQEGTCVACTPRCEGKQCGEDDGCGTFFDLARFSFLTKKSSNRCGASVY